MVKKVQCPFCRQKVSVTPQGTFRRHEKSATSVEACKGSYKRIAG